MYFHQTEKNPSTNCEKLRGRGENHDRKSQNVKNLGSILFFTYNSIGINLFFFEYNFVLFESVIDYDNVIDNGLKAYKIVYNTPPMRIFMGSKMAMKIMEILKLFHFGL